MSKKVLLVVECSEEFNWTAIFAGTCIEIRHVDQTTGEESVRSYEIQVEQATFPDLSVTSYDKSGCVFNIRKSKRPHPGTSMERDRTVVVDFVLLRSVTHGIHGQDSRNILLTMMHAGLPSVNSLLSAYMALERPVMWGELKAIQRRMARRGQSFPLVDQSCHSSHQEMNISPCADCVVKIGHAHAGKGKILLHDGTGWDDVRSICALHGDYITSEPYIPADFDARVQKIGPNYRAFRRTSTNWKMNSGYSSIVTELDEVPEEWRQWADECAQACGGLDILGLDLIHDREHDRFSILELNDTAIGLVHKVAQQDTQHIRDLVLYRMTQHFSSPSLSPSSSSSSSSHGSSSLSQGSTAAQCDPLTYAQAQVTSQASQIQQLRQRLAEVQQQLTEEEESDQSTMLRVAADLAGMTVLIAAAVFLVKRFK